MGNFRGPSANYICQPGEVLKISTDVLAKPGDAFVFDVHSSGSRICNAAFALTGHIVCPVIAFVLSAFFVYSL